ncbi:PTS mannitol transporter subunit IICBA [Lachnoclostridium pacaense]|uniref:PTS mannitol transporter subunit IICB n=1 Tax=Enterocloster hominis (ex Hitch et al. 2024) TaxID=1917870 RepID=UPI001D122870|nr:PTS mannitol transporter subunit IICBA [Lachnoclostridium pacaense]MCC2816267.1 PTS mannitol transporter subunit IICBA [Lachnoclostridium pacaense]
MKEKVQVFGRFLSGMVMPNIGAFIAWGLITALFIPTGWCPNETINALVSPMSAVLLPLLIAYTGGTAVYGQRGGVIGAIAAMGVIVGSDIPMFIGAMIVGPVCAWIIKKFDHLLEGKIPAGFEMLVNNFSLGIIGAVLTVIALKGVAPVVEVMNQAMKSGVGFFVDRKLLPLASVFIEPAKVLFLNNAINHGIFSPMGIQQVEEVGKSVFFLLEANPGPGLGILLAYCIAGKGSAKSSAPGAVIIHFLGGIHEIYFPYILMNPLLILAVMAGGAGGVFMFQLLGAGLTSAASPGSILAILAMTPRGEYFPVLAGVAVAAALSFAIALPLLKFAGKDEDLEDSRKKMSAMKKASKGVKETSACNTSGTDASRAATSGAAASGPIRKIVFACDAGMGSSAMGATVLKKKLTAAGFGDIEVKHSPVSSIPQDAQIVVTHQELGERAAHSNPGAKLVLITNFLAAPEYDQLVEELKKR